MESNFSEKRLFWCGGQKPTHKIEVEFSLQGGRFSMSAGVWDRHPNGKWREDTFGQCLDTVLELLPNDPTIKEMHEVWKRWHLNDMRAGSPAQEAWLRANPFPGHPHEHYTWACEELKKAGLQPDPNFQRDGKPYSYGSAWLLETLPPDIIEKIKGWRIQRAGMQP